MHDDEKRIDVDKLFSDGAIARLAKAGKLPKGSDLQLFCEHVRLVAILYMQARERVSSAEVRVEIETLHKTAKARDAGRLIELLTNVSVETIASLKARAGVRGEAFPTSADLLDEARAGAACSAVEALTRIGGKMGWGRNRQGKEPSWSFLVDLYSPPKTQTGRRRHRPLEDNDPREFRTAKQRSAEREAALALRAAWRWAAARGDSGAEGRIRPKTPAVRSNRVFKSPLASLLEEFLEILSVKGIDAVNVVNSLDKKKAYLRTEAPRITFI
jgi:hypothetical protein